jgi:hypothetical protein
MITQTQIETFAAQIADFANDGFMDEYPLTHFIGNLIGDCDPADIRTVLINASEVNHSRLITRFLTRELTWAGREWALWRPKKPKPEADA